MPAPSVGANLQMDGRSASHPNRREAVAQCRVQFSGRSRCKTARSLRIAFLGSGKATPCRERMRARLKLRSGSCARTSCARQDRRHDCSGFSCDIWAVLALLPVWRRVSRPCRRLVRSSRSELFAVFKLFTDAARAQNPPIARSGARPGGGRWCGV